MSTFRYVEAFLQRYGLTCAKCGAHMQLSVPEGKDYVRARCLSRHCEQYGLVGQISNERVQLIAVDDPDVERLDADVIDVTPDTPKVGGTQ